MIRFLPDEYYSSTYKIDFKKYYDMGYRGILFDIDNTLVRHNDPERSSSWNSSRPWASRYVWYPTTRSQGLPLSTKR